MLGIDSSNGPAPDNRFVSTFKISFNYVFYNQKVCTEPKICKKFWKFTTMISFEVWVLFFLFFMSLSYSEMNRVIKINLF